MIAAAFHGNIVQEHGVPGDGCLGVHGGRFVSVLKESFDSEREEHDRQSAWIFLGATDTHTHAVAKIDERDCLETDFEETRPVESVPCAAEIKRIVEAVASANGFTNVRLSSGAGHDASHVALVAPGP